LEDISLGGNLMLIPPSKRSPMPNPKIITIPKRCFLLLAGLCLIVPTAVSAGSAEARDQPQNITYQHVNAGTVTTITGGADSSSNTRLHLVTVLVVKNDLGEQPGIDDGSSQHVAPRLQSRIKKNPEFAAFVKLVRATSNKKYTPEELQRLYLSFKEWSHKNSAPSQ